MYSAEEAAKLSGIREIWEAGEFAPFVNALRKHEAYRPKPENILMSLAPASAGALKTSIARQRAIKPRFNLLQFPPEGESREYRQEQRFAATWTKESGFTIQSVSPIFAQMRVRKSAMELQLMQHAIDISIEAHQRAQAFASQAKWEYEVDAQVAYTFKLRNADNWGYPDIVGCGPNATTLHYEESQGPVKSGELI